MRLSSLATVVVLLVALSATGCAAANSDGNLLKNLYDAVEAIVVPQYDKNFGAPSQVILFEMPGLVINRDEYDAPTWQTGNFQARQPDAIAAQFVDRLPYYTGPVFVDSGSRISTLWGFFMYQYIIPIVEDPVQAAKALESRSALANGTLQAAYSSTSAAYEAAFNDFVNFRTNCLARQAAGVCASQAVIYRERLLRKWFSLEVARRDLAGAEAKIIMMQVTDMKNIFADQLYKFSSNERVDMGGAGFGQTYYQTYLTPSNFYKWWPSTGKYDYGVQSDGSTVTLSIPSNAWITTPAAFGTMTPLMGGNYTYTPNTGFTGSDKIAFTYAPGGSAPNITTTYIVQVVGPDVLAADSAFVRVSASSASSQKTTKSFSSQFEIDVSASGAYAGVSVSGSFSASTSKSSDSMTASGSTFTMTFDVARVAITRPWIDTAILAFYPVAIRGVSALAWSDGSTTPAKGSLDFKFKLLPVAFLVARSINLEFKMTESASDLQTSADKYSGSLSVSYGPFFSGSASSSYGSTSRDYRESSKSSGNGINIRGPQIIGWLCTVVPPFPNSNEAGVRKWEAEQINRQTAATTVASAATSAGLIAATPGSTATTTPKNTTA